MHIDEAGIVELFAERRPFYGLGEVERLLAVTPEWLSEVVAEGRLDSVSLDTGPAFAWDDLVGLILEWRTPREIARIMARAGRDSDIPFQHRFHTITVELPLYQIRLLHELANARSVAGQTPRTASDVLEYELEMIAHGEGVVASISLESFHEQPEVTDGCLYCGIPVASEESLCVTCAARHVPSDVVPADPEG